MDAEWAAWLAGIIREAAWKLDEGPCVIIEVEGNPSLWMQVLPQADEAGALDHFLINMPYRGAAGDPLQRIGQVGLILPPGTEAAEWEDDGFATLRLRADVPLVAFSLLIDDLLRQLLGAQAPYEVNVQVEYGY